MEQMVSVIHEETGFGNREWPSVSGVPKYKRRKVSACRDFPPGCGPNSMLIGSRMSAEAASGINGETNRQKGDDLPEVEVDRKVESSVDSQTVEKTACTIVVGNGELMDVEDGDLNGGPLQESIVATRIWCRDTETNSHLGEKSTVTLFSGQELEAVEANGNGTAGLNFKDEVVEDTNEVEEMKVEENGVETCLLPYYPIPSNFVWKERKYPPRRSHSAKRDFPSGCGPSVAGKVVGGSSNAVLKMDQLFSGGKGETGKCKDIVRSVVDDIRKNFKDDDAMHFETQDNPSAEETGDSFQDRSKFCKVASTKVNERLVQAQGRDGVVTYKLDSKPGKPTLCTKGERDTVMTDRLNEAKELSLKDTSNKRKFDGISGSNILESRQAAVLDDFEDRVIAQGLMAAPNCPWRQQARVGTKSMLSTSMGKGNRLKVCRPGGNKVSKLIASKKQDDVGCSYLVMGKDTHEGAGPLVLRDDRADYEEKLNDFQLVRRSREYAITLPPSSAGSSGDKDSRRKVRESLRLFQGLVRKLTQEEESKRKGKGATSSARIDQIAAKILKDSGKYVNRGKPIIGHVPGVEVGDEFHFRAELMIIGLHHPPVGGIDSVKRGETLLATSVVASGGYDNEVDSSDSLTYIGQGGAKSKDKEAEDQKLERGNLALKNSSEEKNDVRVIRGYKESKGSRTVSTYTYDGLYIVERYWHEVGAHGKMVYKFELKRKPGQPELAWKEVKKSNKSKQRPGRCVDDISGGKEPFPISAINTIDGKNPPAFTYITRMLFPDWYRRIPPKGCDCVDGCSDSEKCSCAVRNGGEIPFNFNGAIVDPKPLIFECGPCCKCPATCHNRVIQHGIKFQLEIFKTASKGWGVRSLSSIPSGSFICEYLGELIEDKEAEQRIGNDEYLFDIGQNYDDQGLHDGVSMLMPDTSSASSDVVQEGYTIDAAKYANVARFINHSCNPNLYAQNILYDNDDKRFPHIGLFAMENIPPLQELTYHYNYTIDEVRDSDGNIKRKNCYCGSSDCTGRMY